MDNLESEGEGNKKNRDIHPCFNQGSTVVLGCVYKCQKNAL